MWGDALVREGVRGRGGGLYKLGGGLRWFDFESGLYVRVDRLLLRGYRRPRVGGLYVRLYVRLWGHGAASSACTWRSSVLMRGVWRGVRRVSETRDGRWHCTASGHAREVDSMQMRAVAARRPAATDRGVWRVLVRRGAEAVAQTLVSLSQRRSARREGVWRLRHCTFEGWLTCDDACGACGTLRLLICGDWQSSRQEWRAKRACRPADRACRRRIEDRTAATWQENLQNEAVT